jgi:RsiW-degrading membrane proteinase PrsW (M82 family)
MEKVYRNTAIFIILILIGVQWGFYQTYTSQFPNFINKTPTIHVHGIFLMMWMALLIAQPLLISTGRAKLHRSIGKVSFVLGPLIIATMFLVGKGSYNRAIGLISEKENLATMVLDVRGFLTFAVFWALAMFYRKIPASHMRYMIATGIIAIGPGVGRGLINSFGVGFGPALTITDVLDLAIVGFLLGYDIYRKKNYKPFLIVFIVFLIGAILWQVRYGAAWQSFAKTYAAWFY